MNDTVRQFRDLFVSLKLTVVLLVLGMLLVFGATLDQTNLGIWGIQHKWFKSFFVLQPMGSIPVPIFPGGYLIGGLLLINLVSAHIYRFKFAWRKSGILLTHIGLIMLLIGELLTGLWQEEYAMRLTEGEPKNYSESYRSNELVIIDTTDPTTEDVVAIPEKLLERGEVVQHGKLPFRVIPKLYYPNSGLSMRPEGGAEASRNQPPSLATTGVGLRVAAVPQPITYKQDERNVPSGFIDLMGPEGSLGIWMVSADPRMTAQTFQYGGRSYKIALRFTRAYKPYTLTLLKFSHDRYAGTEIPKNFSSRVRLQTPDGRDDREALIYMNNPMRYAGLTFYQASFEPGNDKVTILQVVRNPSWVMPYVACSLMTLGLVIQFGIHLVAFVQKRRAPVAQVKPQDGRSALPRRSATVIIFPLAVVLLGLGAVVKSLAPTRNSGKFDIVGFGKLPVLANGRVKPLDTLARSTLLQLQGRQPVRSVNASAPLVSSPTEWLLDVVFRPEQADTYPTFAIDNPDLLTLLGKTDETLQIKYDSTAKEVLSVVGFLPSRFRRFTFQEIWPHREAIQKQAQLAGPVESAIRTPFQRAILQLYGNLVQYQGLKHMLVMSGRDDFLSDLLRLQDKLPESIAAVRARQAGEPHDEATVKALLDIGEQFRVMEGISTFLVIPPDTGDDPTGWRTAGTALLSTFQTGRVNSSALAYAGLAQGWRQQEPEKFNKLIELFTAGLEKRFAPQLGKSGAEARFNAAEPFYLSMELYGFAFLFGILSWLAWPDPLRRAAFGLTAVAWIVATAGIATRMWLEGRPPVTNLYSSALFVGWGAVGLCLVLEVFYKNAIGSVAAGVIGFATLLIAHHLSLSGDTLEMMRAVLDSNFWLATHVVVVTAGYSATFLAGFLALIYIARGLFTPSLDKFTAESLARMVYGIVCFATLFSFAGTVLGGIWADQSWGRFWGWDPKENGALIIVIWNAIILHARWGGMIRQRGLMCLAIGGNIVTSWSWFGTNMLGVGLHSYG
ncbi:MAG: hypothetical protein RIQ93_577, partial [Verrucomicrobiota bacterium]